jgi:hypothetical protein
MNDIKYKIKVKHTVVPDMTVLDILFDTLVMTAKAAYPSVEMETEALIACKHEVVKEIHHMVEQAFRVGRKIGKVRADEEDTMMYAP